MKSPTRRTHGTETFVVLPQRGTFDSFETEFGVETYRTLVDSLEAGEGVVEFPRFEFSSAYRLEDALEALGMPAAFDAGLANFSGIAEGDAGRRLRVDEVYHDTHVAVDEQGTEAAAATGSVINIESGTTNQFEFVANRPFLFVIRDRPTGTVLFVGRVADPTSS